MFWNKITFIVTIWKHYKRNPFMTGGRFIAGRIMLMMKSCGTSVIQFTTWRNVLGLTDSIAGFGDNASVALAAVSTAALYRPPPARQVRFSSCWDIWSICILCLGLTTSGPTGLTPAVQRKRCCCRPGACGTSDVSSRVVVLRLKGSMLCVRLTRCHHSWDAWYVLDWL